MTSAVNKYIIWIVIGIFSLITNEVRSCHALGLLNPSINVTATGVEVNADSDPATCASGCNNSVYWMDIEVRCVGESWNPAPFSPGFYGPLTTYPFFQSAQMQKPNCVAQSYPTTFVPFGTLCPGDYQIRFRENHNGNTGGWTAPFVFTVPGTPPVLSGNVTTVKDTVCAGECTLISASVNGGCGLAPTYSWSTGSSNAQTNVCPTTDSVFTVTITELCSQTTTQASLEIIVIPAPSAGTASSTETAVCEGDSVDLTLVGYEDDIQWESAPSSAGPWTDIVGATGDNIMSPPINANVRCFRARVGDCGTPSYSNEVCITVNDIPTITADDYSICDGETIDITTTVSDPGGDYLWTFDGSTNATLVGQSPSDTTDYIVNYTLNGCSDTDTSTVVVFKSPTAAFSVDSVCLTEATSFVDNSNLDNSNNDIIDEWSWDFDDGNTSTQQNPSHVYDSESIYDIKLVVTTNNGCEDSITALTAVYPKPNVDFNLTEACLGFENEFSDNSSVSNQFTSNTLQDWLWEFGDGSQSTDINPSHQYDNDGDYSVQLVVTTDKGCVDSLTKTAEVHALPETSFEPDTTVSCSPLCVTINSTSDINNPSSIVNYTWIIDGNPVQSGSEEFYEDCFTNNSTDTRTHDVKLITESNEGCLDSASVEDLLTVYHNPFADFSYTPEYIDVIETEVELTNMSVGEDSVFWTFGTFDQSSEQNPVIEFPTVGGQYNVNLLALTEEGCRDSINTFITVDSRILYFAPNTFTPDEDEYNPEFKIIFPDGFIPEDFKLLIFNRWGEVVFESRDSSIGWDGTYGTDTGRKAPSGTYVWTLEFKEIATDKKHSKTGHVTILR